MIIGIGTDIVDVHRIQRLLDGNSRFIERVFTAAEIGYCNTRANPAQSYAARFAAKEALMKALGTGWDGVINWLDIEVRMDQLGKPLLQIHGATKTRLEALGCDRIHLSLAHEKDHALAMVVLEAN